MATILVVDDHDDTNDILCRLIRSWGYKAVGAPTGEAALALLATLRPDLLIVDGMMPGMNGVELIRLVRADPHTATIPAILFTALDERQFHENAIAKGANECWIKGELEYSQMKERVEWYVSHRPDSEGRGLHK